MVKKRLDKTFMVLVVRYEEVHEVVLPEQLCCHELFYVISLPSH